MRSLAIAGLLLVLSAAPAAAQPAFPQTYLLSDGSPCNYVSGATAAIAGARANYACPDGTYLWGGPYALGDELVMLSSGGDLDAYSQLAQFELVVVSEA